MRVIISSKNQEKTFEHSKCINIGTSSQSDFCLNLSFDLTLSLQYDNARNKWIIINNFKNDKILFRGQPLAPTLELGTLCKLMLVDGSDYISIKIVSESTSNVQEIVKKVDAVQAQAPQKTITMIGDEELNEDDIRELYGTGINAQTKIKLDKKKADIEKRRTIINKEIAYKVDHLKRKLSQGDKILSALNTLIVVVPFFLANILKDTIYIMGVNNRGSSIISIEMKIVLIVAIAFVINTLILKQGTFMQYQNKNKARVVTPANIRIQRLCSLVSLMLFGSILVYSIVAMETILRATPLIPQMLILCSFLCLILGLFAGFIKNLNTEVGEELDSYENREDFQAIVKDYQQWIGFFVNNTTRKRIANIKDALFNLQIKSAGEYLIGIFTAPFLAYGVSQTLALCFPDAAGWIRISGLTLSPVFLMLASLMIIFAFHCFSTSFAISKEVNASDVIKRDGFSDYNIHGVALHGLESSKNLKKEASKFFFMALAVVIIEVTMNVSYFISEMGDDIRGMLLSLVAALVPTAILLMETTMLGKTKFKINIREELLQKIDKDI